MTHTLKVWPGSYEAIVRGDKRHEIRKCDRDFKVNDFLILKEFVPNGTQDVETHATLGEFTGRTCLRKITYITPANSWGLPADVCVLSIK